MPSGDVRAVLFDFSGTLARLEHRGAWFDGMGLDDRQREEVMDRMTHPSISVDHHAWEYRDLDPDLHREAYMHVLREAGLPEQHAVTLYERVIDPQEWELYPDTVPTLKALRQNGIGTAVVSNIPWDVRLALGPSAADVDEFVLSCEVGAIKPDPRIFEIALSRLGVPARETLMVGDSEENDGAAVELGCAFALVNPLPISERPTGLIDALRGAGLSL